MGPALNCDQDMFRLQLRCSGGTSNLGVDAGLRGRLSSSLDGFEGWCSPRCFGPRTASGSCCGDGGSSLVRVSGLRGAYRPSNEHEDGRPVALKTDLDWKKKKKKMDQPPRQTSGPTLYQSDSANQVLPSKTHQVDSKRDYGPPVQTTLTLKIIHRVVKLILHYTPKRLALQGQCWDCLACFRTLWLGKTKCLVCKTSRPPRWPSC